MIENLFFLCVIIFYVVIGSFLMVGLDFACFLLFNTSPMIKIELWLFDRRNK